MNLGGQSGPVESKSRWPVTGQRSSANGMPDRLPIHFKQYWIRFQLLLSVNEPLLERYTALTHTRFVVDEQRWICYLQFWAYSPAPESTYRTLYSFLRVIQWAKENKGAKSLPLFWCEEQTWFHWNSTGNKKDLVLTLWGIPTTHQPLLFLARWEGGQDCLLTGSSGPSCSVLLGVEGWGRWQGRLVGSNLTWWGGREGRGGLGQGRMDPLPT